MSIISDVTGTFSSDVKEEDFTIFKYQQGNSLEVAFRIYGVLNIGRSQTNEIPDKPLEGGQFTHDSQNIKPYDFTITGVLADNIAKGYDIRTDLQTMKQYQNGVQLLSVYNNYTFEEFKPLKMYVLNYETNVEQTVPLIRIGFKQIQVGVPSNFRYDQVPNPRDPAKLPQIETIS